MIITKPSGLVQARSARPRPAVGRRSRKDLAAARPPWTLLRPASSAPSKRTGG